MLKTTDYMNILHEIKNSLTLINSSLQLITKQHPEVAAYDLWDDTIQELDYLKNLISEASQSGAVRPANIRPVNLYKLVSEVTDSLQGLTNFHCETEIEENLPLVPMDAVRIKQALINLIKNAYDAMQQTGTIYFCIHTKDSFLQMDIVDFGGGINENVKDSFFEPFVTSKVNGTGLGLSISQQIAEEHSGKLVCDSRPGDGCTFSLLLPLTGI